MLLEEISLTNFKCFHEQKLTLSKITLLLGANSSGKSSLICAILGAIQSDQFPLLFSSNGTYTDMGDFRSISHAHKSDHKFGISLKFRSDTDDSILVSGRFGESSDSKMPELSSAEFNDGLFNLKIVRNDRYEAEWSYSPGDDPARKSLEDENFQALMLAMNKMMKKGETGAGNKGEHPLSLADQFDVTKIPSSMKFAFNHPRRFLNLRI